MLVVLYFVWEKKRERNGSWRDGHTAIGCTYNSCVHINVPALAFTLFGLWDACLAPKGKRWHLGIIKKKGQMCKFLFSLRPKCIIFPKTVGKEREIHYVVAMYKTVRWMAIPCAGKFFFFFFNLTTLGLLSPALCWLFCTKVCRNRIQTYLRTSWNVLYCCCEYKETFQAAVELVFYFVHV